MSEASYQSPSGVAGKNQAGADTPTEGPGASTAGTDQVYPDGRDDRGTSPDNVGSTETREDAAAVAPSGALVSDGDSFRTRWSSVQVGFVDDPGRAVEEAERLVNDVITDLVEGFRRQRERLDDDQNASTDDLRIAFHRYRDFFDRLLNV